MYSLVNQARFAAGLPGVLRNSSMDAVAEAWANQMGSNAAMSHNPQYSAQIPAGWNRAGENVAEGYPTPQAMFNGWMKSPGTARTSWAITPTLESRLSASKARPGVFRTLVSTPATSDRPHLCRPNQCRLNLCQLLHPQRLCLRRCHRHRLRRLLRQ